LDFSGKDPDDYLNINGYQKFRDLIKQPSSAIEFTINYEFSKINTNNYQEKKNLVTKLVQDLTSRLDVFDQEYYYSYLANLSGISFDLIKSFATRQPIKQINQVSAPKPTATSKSDIESASANILFYLMREQKYYDIFVKEIGTFINPYYRKLFNIIAAIYIENEKFNLPVLKEMNIEEQYLVALNEIYFAYSIDVLEDDLHYLDVIDTLRLEGEHLELSKLQEQLRSLEDPTLKAELSLKIIELDQRIKKIKYHKFNK
jgi:DNA primase